MRRLGNLAALVLAVITPTAVLAAPPLVPPHSAPATLYNLDRKIRFVSLAEARANALEHDMIGQPSLLFPGIGLDNLATALQGKSDIHGRVICKSGSKCLILTGIHRDPQHERNINQLLLNIENAYWNLYGSYWQLYSREQGLRLAYETWKITQAQYRVGRVSQAALAQAEGQYNLFRSQRLQAIDTVLDNERQLRAMMGLQVEDGERLVPSDAPTLVEKKPDWHEGFQAAMEHRPELRMSRQDVELGALSVEIWQALAKHRPSEDGVRQAESQLERARLVLQDQELKAERFLGLYYRRMSSAYSQIKTARAQREAFATQLQVRYELYRAGANEPGTGNPVALNLLLEAQRFWAEALATECQAIVTYNNALAGWAYATGEIMKHAHVRLAADAPPGETVQAVEREHKRTRQHVRHESTVSAESPLTVLDACGSEAKAAPSLPALWKRFPSLKKAGEVQTGLVEGRALDLN